MGKEPRKHQGYFGISRGKKSRLFYSIGIPAFLGKNAQYKGIFNTVCVWMILHMTGLFYNRDLTAILLFTHMASPTNYTLPDLPREFHIPSPGHIGLNAFSYALPLALSWCFCWKLGCSFCFGFRVASHPVRNRIYFTSLSNIPSLGSMLYHDELWPKIGITWESCEPVRRRLEQRFYSCFLSKTLSPFSLQANKPLLEE